MTRSLRLEFPGALYHVTARGDRRRPIYADHDDRRLWLTMLAVVCARFNFVVYAYCQMENHYHLMIETIDGNLSRGMRELNGVYSQSFNRRHRLVGHVFQGRYKAILVQKESYLLELARYIVLNPVRAEMAPSADAWRWSSQCIMTGVDDCPSWFDRAWLLARFGTAQQHAVQAYCQFVAEGLDASSPLEHTRHQIILGDKDFVAKHAERFAQEELVERNREQRRLFARSLGEYRETYHCRDEAMARAYKSTVFTMTEIGAYFGVSLKTVSRAVQRFEAEPVRSGFRQH